MNTRVIHLNDDWKLDDQGGRVNVRAILKVSILISWIVIGGAMAEISSLPDYPQVWLVKQWIIDVADYSNNSTMWEELQPMTRTMYYVIPVFYLGLFMLWAMVFRRFRRKILYVNGVRYGTVMWIYGHRLGHIYDLACLMNGGRHFKDWKDFPRPISGRFMEGRTIVYYRPGIIHHPAEWYRLIMDECIIYNWGVQVIVPLENNLPISVFSHRITDRLRSNIVYSDLSNTTDLETVNMDLVELTQKHKDTQTQILETTWRMARAEPGTALAILRKSSYALPDRTVARFWDKLDEKDKSKLREEWKRA